VSHRLYETSGVGRKRNTLDGTTKKRSTKRLIAVAFHLNSNRSQLALADRRVPSSSERRFRAPRSDLRADASTMHPDGACERERLVAPLLRYSRVSLLALGSSALGAALTRSLKSAVQSVAESDGYLSRCVTFARATANACNALNGYWKSNVYALPSILPNCIT